MGKRESAKGGQAEELLRAYFSQLGYYVVRGAQVYFRREAITDVDLWLYARPSPLSRERTNVDIRRQRSPRAFERILWARALQESLDLDRCIVVTTDKRPIVKEYAEKQGVLVLDGHFWGRLETKKLDEANSRLGEEGLFELISRGREDALQGRWRERLELSKGRLLTDLDFNGINASLREVGYFSDQVVARRSPEVACRLVYLNLSYMLIGLDFAFRLLGFGDRGSVVESLEDGFRFGANGQEKIARLVELSRKLISSYSPASGPARSQLELNLAADLKSLPAASLAEFFSRPDIRRSIFPMSVEFEACAYARRFRSPDVLGNHLKSVLGLVLDFHGMNRIEFFEAFATPGSAQHKA